MARKRNQLRLDDVFIVCDQLVVATDAQVSKAEMQIGSALPQGYREYVTRLGDGLLNGALYVIPPTRLLATRNEAQQRWRDYYLWEESQDVLGKDALWQCHLIATLFTGSEFIVHPRRPDHIFYLARHTTIAPVGDGIAALLDTVFDPKDGTLRYFEPWSPRNSASASLRTDGNSQGLREALIRLQLHDAVIENCDPVLLSRQIGGTVTIRLDSQTVVITCARDKVRSAAVRKITHLLRERGFDVPAFRPVHSPAEVDKLYTTMRKQHHAKQRRDEAAGRLEISGDIDDSALAKIVRDNPRLNSITFHNSQITPQGLVILTDLKSLRHLNISDCRARLGSTAYRTLAQCGTLQSIELCNTNASNRALAHLAGLRRLKKLVVDGASGSITSIENLVPLAPQLEFLAVYEAGIKDDGLKAITAFKKLKHLDLSGTKITRKSIGLLAKLPNLRTLILNDVETLRDVALSSLRQIRSLRRVSLTVGAGTFTDSGVDALRRTCPRFRVDETRVVTVPL